MGTALHFLLRVQSLKVCLTTRVKIFRRFYLKMALPTTPSFFVSSILTLILFAGMQIFKVDLGSGRLMTIFGGFLGSQIFVFLLTAINNLERVLFGPAFQSKLFPEVLACLVAAMFASGLVH